MDGIGDGKRESAVVEPVSRFSYHSLFSSLGLSLCLSFPSSPLLAAFSSFHTPLSQFSSPTGPELYNRPPPPPKPSLRFIAEIARTLAIASHREKKRRLDVSRGQERPRRSDNSRVSHSRVLFRQRPAGAVTAADFFAFATFFFSSRRAEFHRRNAISVF